MCGTVTQVKILTDFNIKIKIENYLYEYVC